MITLYEAIKFAHTQHLHRLRRFHEPYINHCMRVMMTLLANGAPEWLLICAVCHDVIEKTPALYQDLQKKGFTEEMLIVMEIVTKQDGESSEEHFTRVTEHGNSWALELKAADLSDNKKWSKKDKRVWEAAMGENYNLEHWSDAKAKYAKRLIVVMGLLNPS